MTIENMEYFFCYSRENSEFVLKLANELRTAGVNLWLDQLDIKGGDHWDSAVERALEKCGGMILVISPESVTSRNVLDEVSYGLEEKKRIIPILYKPCKIPYRWRRLHQIEFKDDYDGVLRQLLTTMGFALPSKPSEQAAQPAQSEKRDQKKAVVESEPLKNKPAERKSELQKPSVPKRVAWFGIIIALIVVVAVVAILSFKDKPTKFEPNVPHTFTNGIGMEFVLIPAGSFTMGSSPGTGRSRERPSRIVNISNSFYLQTTEVTQRQWKKVMGNNPSKFKGCDDCPVEEVSWNDTQDFINKLNEIEAGEAYRLPTEAEWEYAVRAGTQSLFSFGYDEEKLTEYGWFDSNSKHRTHPAGTKKPNPWGLYDMHGNLWEWVEDDWHADYEGAPVDGRAWVDEPRGNRRVVRGGCWVTDAHFCRSASRSSASPGDGGPHRGFRLSRSVPPGP